MKNKRTSQLWVIVESTLSKNEDLEEGVGPYLLTTLARQCDFDISVFQASQYGCDDEQIAEIIKTNTAAGGIVTFSVFSGGLDLLKKIVERLGDQYPIIIGGPGATTDPSGVLKKLPDKTLVALVPTEADEVFPKLLNHNPNHWLQVPEVWIRNANGIKPGVFNTLQSLDQKPFADLSSSILRQKCARIMRDSQATPNDRLQAIQALQHCFVEARRGCFYHCEFCSAPHLIKNGVRQTSPSRAVAEVAYLFENFSITFFNYTDNIAFDAEVWWQEYAELLQQLPFAHLLQFGGYGTPKFFSKGTWLTDTLPRLYHAGLNFVTVGVQSGSPRMLKEIIHRPSDDPENALRVTEAMVPLGINVKTDFIVGHPTETVADLQMTLDLIERLHHAGGQIFARRLGVVPKSGYDFRLQEGRYQLPEPSTESEAIVAKILKFHGQKDAYKRVAMAHGDLPNLWLIDRKKKILFPRQSLDLEVLRKHQQRLGDLPEMLKERFTLLFEAVIQKKTANPTS